MMEDEIDKYNNMSSFDKSYNKRHDFSIPLAVSGSGESRNFF